MDYPPTPNADAAPGAEPQSHIQRGEPDTTEQRRSLVQDVLKEVKKDREHFEKAFKRMRKDMTFVRKQLPGETEDDDRAKVNIVQRHVNTRTASLYAKNPTFVAERRKTLDYAVWDGKKATLDRAAAEISSGLPPSPETQALLADIQDAINRQQMLKRVGDTMEILLTYSIDEQQPPFKARCKQTVRRTVATGVGFVKLCFQRQLAKRPDSEAKLADITDRLANIERMEADQADKITDEVSAEAERLRLARDELKNEQDIVVREGLVFDFPRSTHIILDRSTTQIAPGFPGARRVSEMFLLTSDQIKEVYGVDIGSSFTGYRLQGQDFTRHDGDDAKACVYETYDRKDGLKYVTCEGYPDFLGEPAAPDLYYIEPFFPFFPLTFNPIEDEEDIYPDSDVRLLMPTQKEINRKKEAIRQHRIANRPLNVARKGVLTETDAKSLAGHAAHDVIELEGLNEGEDVAKAFAPFPKPGVDPNLYETATDLDDISLMVGTQQANLGSTNSDSATQSSIAETTRVQDIASNIDDLDDWLSSIARAAGQVLLHEMSIDTVKRIAGPGAVWPELRAQEIAEEVSLKIEAGSSGRPNNAQDLANLERAMPYIMQTPGMNPEYLLRYVLKLLNPHISYEEAITAGLPSITAMNRQAQLGTGNAASDPNAQGPEGGDNAAAPAAGPGGAQPGFPATAAEPAAS